MLVWVILIYHPIYLNTIPAAQLYFRLLILLPLGSYRTE